MKTALVVASGTLALCACGTVNKLEPDGGRDRGACTAEFASMAVHVVDAAGAPVDGATVTARNAGLGLSQTGTTNSAGNTTAVNQDIGQGTVTVTASLGTRVSDTQQCTWTCSDQCLCAVQPVALTLTLGP